MKIGISIVHFVIKVPKLVQMIVTKYRVQAYQVPIENPRWPPKNPRWPPRSLVFLHFNIIPSDFPRIIEIALFNHLFTFLFSYELLTCLKVDVIELLIFSNVFKGLE